MIKGNRIGKKVERARPEEAKVLDCKKLPGLSL